MEAFVPLPVSLRNPLGLIATEVVHVDTVGCVRFQRLVELTLFVVPLGVGPLRCDREGECPVAVWEGSRIVGALGDHAPIHSKNTVEYSDGIDPVYSRPVSTNPSEISS